MRLLLSGDERNSHYRRGKMIFADLQGKQLVNITNVDGIELLFECDTGEIYELSHYQDCCEEVRIESIVGDLEDLIGTPILLAEEATSESPPDGFTPDYEQESQTWTFYKLRTIKGSVDIRWYGTSNGYYSESVDCIKWNPMASAPLDGTKVDLTNFDTAEPRCHRVFTGQYLHNNVWMDWYRGIPTQITPTHWTPC